MTFLAIHPKIIITPQHICEVHQEIFQDLNPRMLRSRSLDLYPQISQAVTCVIVPQQFLRRVLIIFANNLGSFILGQQESFSMSSL